MDSSGVKFSSNFPAGISLGKTSMNETIFESWSTSAYDRKLNKLIELIYRMGESRLGKNL